MVIRYLICCLSCTSKFRPIVPLRMIFAKARRAETRKETFLTLKKVFHGGKYVLEKLSSDPRSFLWLCFFSFLSPLHHTRGTYPCVDQILSKRKRLAPIGISSSSPHTTYSVRSSLHQGVETILHRIKIRIVKRFSCRRLPSHRVSHRFNLHCAPKQHSSTSLLSSLICNR